MIDSNTLLPVVCLDESNDLNTSHPLPGIIPERPYLLIGKVAQEVPAKFLSWSAAPFSRVLRKSRMLPIDHYILWDIRTGKGVPGMFHGDRFRYVTVEDDFF